MFSAPAIMIMIMRTYYCKLQALQDVSSLCQVCQTLLCRRVIGSVFNVFLNKRVFKVSFPDDAHYTLCSILQGVLSLLTAAALLHFGSCCLLPPSPPPSPPPAPPAPAAAPAVQLTPDGITRPVDPQARV